MCVYVLRLYSFSFFIVLSENKTLPGTDFTVEDMKENIRAIFVYVAANFESNSGNIF